MKYVVIPRFLTMYVLITMTNLCSAHNLIRGKKAAAIVIDINNSTLYDTPPFSVSIHVNTSSGGCKSGVLECEDGYACCAIHMPREWWCCSVSEKCGDARGQCLRPHSNNHINQSQQHRNADDENISVDVESTTLGKQDVVLESAQNPLNVSQTTYPPEPRHHRHHHKHGRRHRIKAQHKKETYVMNGGGEY